MPAKSLWLQPQLGTWNRRHPDETIDPQCALQKLLPNLFAVVQVERLILKELADVEAKDRLVVNKRGQHATGLAWRIISLSDYF